MNKSEPTIVSLTPKGVARSQNLVKSVFLSSFHTQKWPKSILDKKSQNFLCKMVKSKWGYVEVELSFE